MKPTITMAVSPKAAKQWRDLRRNDIVLNEAFQIGMIQLTSEIVSAARWRSQALIPWWKFATNPPEDLAVNLNWHYETAGSVHTLLNLAGKLLDRIPDDEPVTKEIKDDLRKHIREAHAMALSLLTRRNHIEHKHRLIGQQRAGGILGCGIKDGEPEAKHPDVPTMEQYLQDAEVSA